MCERNYNRSYKNMRKQIYSPSYKNVWKKLYNRSYKNMWKKLYILSYTNVWMKLYNLSYKNVWKKLYNSSYKNMWKKLYNRSYKNMYLYRGLMMAHKEAGTDYFYWTTVNLLVLRRDVFRFIAVCKPVFYEIVAQAQHKPKDNFAIYKTRWTLYSHLRHSCAFPSFFSVDPDNMWASCHIDFSYLLSKFSLPILHRLIYFFKFKFKILFFLSFPVKNLIKAKLCPPYFFNIHFFNNIVQFIPTSFKLNLPFILISCAFLFTPVT